MKFWLRKWTKKQDVNIDVNYKTLGPQVKPSNFKDHNSKDRHKTIARNSNTIFTALLQRHPGVVPQPKAMSIISLALFKRILWRRLRSKPLLEMDTLIFLERNSPFTPPRGEEKKTAQHWSQPYFCSCWEVILKEVQHQANAHCGSQTCLRTNPRRARIKTWAKKNPEPGT